MTAHRIYKSQALSILVIPREISDKRQRRKMRRNVSLLLFINVYPKQAEHCQQNKAEDENKERIW